MQTDLCNLDPTTGDQLVQVLRETRPSSPGMDNIAPYELKLLAHWCPSFFNLVADLLHSIEKHGKWPSDPRKIFLYRMGRSRVPYKLDFPGPFCSDLRVEIPPFCSKSASIPRNG